MNTQQGLSILVAVYNYSIKELMTSIAEQINRFSAPVELIFCDDCSSDTLLTTENKQISSQYSFSKYIILPQNIGRAAIRNQLAQYAYFSHFLFIDVDSKIHDSNYLNNYWNQIASDVVLVGGTIYTEKPDAQHSLRYYYGKEREEIPAYQRNKHPYDAITLNNIFIPREIYLRYPLDEKLTQYGHEDTKFGYDLKRNQIALKHLDNPVEHIGLETNTIFLDKTKAGVENLVQLMNQGYASESKLVQTYQKLKRFHSLGLFRFFYFLISGFIVRNLHSTKPSIRFFDIYKLHFFIAVSRYKKGN